MKKRIELSCSVNAKESIEFILDKFGAHFAIYDENGNCHEIQLDQQAALQFVEFVTEG